MIGHVVIAMLKWAFGSSTIPTVRPTGRPYIERTNIVTGETTQQIAARLDANQREWTRQRKEISPILPIAPKQTSPFISGSFTPPAQQYKIPIPNRK